MTSSGGGDVNLMDEDERNTLLDAIETAAVAQGLVFERDAWAADLMQLVARDMLAEGRGGAEMAGAAIEYIASPDAHGHDVV